MSYHLKWRTVDIKVYSIELDLIERTIEEEQKSGWEVYNIQTYYYNEYYTWSLVRIIFNTQQRD
jgi:hypothetical protein